MIAKNLWRRATRSLLTALGIAIGVAAVVALGAMADGISSNYGNALGLSNDILVSQANTFDVVISNLDETLGERIRAVPDVANVDPGVFGWITVGNSPYFLIYGYEPGSVAIQHYRIVEGKPVTNAKQIALGQRAAETLKLGLDDTLRLGGAPYRIVGIYETGQGMEESGGVVTLQDAQEIAQKQRQVSLFQVGLRPGADADLVVERIANLEDGLSVSKASEMEANEQWTVYLDGFAWGIAAIAVLIGGLGMMSAMVMSVMERTREIGTLRAVGWSRGRVLRMILGESILLSLAGGAVGVVLGLFLAWAAAQIPGVGAFLEGAVSLGVIVQGLLTALVLGLVGGVYPAWTAANLQPVEALRYEGGAAAAAGGPLSQVGNQSFRNLWRRRTRTLISAAGIGVGVATLVMMGGLVDGVMGQMGSLAGSGGTGSLTVMQREAADMSLSTLDERVVSAIQSMPQVKSVSPIIMGFIMSEELPLFIFFGLDPNNAAIDHFTLVEGRHVQRPNEIVLGKKAAETYKLGVGDTMVVNESRYKVVGIMETGIAWEDGAGMVALRESQRMLGRQRTVSFIFLDVHEPSQAEAVAAAINRRFPEARASMSSEWAADTNDMQQTAAMMSAIQGLVLIIGGIVVANTMIMSIYERTREIGTLRALGWSQSRIISQIVQESLYLCLLAAILGCILGVIFLDLLTLLPFIGAVISPAWSLSTFTTAIITALSLGLIGGLYPAWRASRLQPVEALHYE